MQEYELMANNFENVWAERNCVTNFQKETQYWKIIDNADVHCFDSQLILNLFSTYSPNPQLILNLFSTYSQLIYFSLLGMC
jgi:hypothetical protein